MKIRKMMAYDWNSACELRVAGDFSSSLLVDQRNLCGTGRNSQHGAACWRGFMKTPPSHSFPRMTSKGYYSFRFLEHNQLFSWQGVFLKFIWFDGEEIRR